MRTTTLKPGRFLLVSLIAAILAPAVYFIAINFWLVSSTETIPSNYKKFLITNSTGPRIIIDSGSNSYYSIDAYALSARMGRTVVNMADNADYSFKHKVNYLTRYAKKGDIILLPLEWKAYSASSIHANYVSAILHGKINHYFESLSLEERLYFVFQHAPANTFLDAFIKRVGEPRTTNWKLTKLNEYKERALLLNSNSLGSNLVNNKRSKHHLDCDSYVFYQQLRGGFDFGEDFLLAMNKLKDAAERGIRVVFAWPVVVDYDNNNRCYQSDLAKNRLVGFSTKVREHLVSHGFEIIGTPEDSHYSSEYYNDTYFHLTRKGASLHTDKLADMLTTAGVTPIKDGVSIDSKLHALAVVIDNMRSSITVD